MKLKQLLTFALAGILLVGTIATGSAAELDYKWYAEQNPDVVAEVGDSPEALKLHYDMYGRKEARMANTKDVEAQLRRLFDVEEYVKLYPDVKEFYGDDAEAMFMHYISYGMLEARRPSEKVSQAVANSLKGAIEKALTDVGVEAVPGSLELVAVITGEKEALVEAKPELALDTAKFEEVTKALEQVTVVVEKTVTETVKEVNDPTPPPSSGGDESSSADPSAVLWVRWIKPLYVQKYENNQPAGPLILLTDDNVNEYLQFVKAHGSVKEDYVLPREGYTVYEPPTAVKVEASSVSPNDVSPGEAGTQWNVSSEGGYLYFRRGDGDGYLYSRRDSGNRYYDTEEDQYEYLPINDTALTEYFNVSGDDVTELKGGKEVYWISKSRSENYVGILNAYVAVEWR